MGNQTTESEQKSMSWIAFNIMRVVMSIRKNSRDIEEEIGLAGIKSGNIVLDYGCGLGYNTIPAAQKVGEKGKVVALDISPQSIRIVKNKIARKQLENIEIGFADGLFRLKNGVFDIVYLHNTLPFVQNKSDVLNEISRILKPGGKLSYVSRKNSRIMGDDTLTDQDLIKLLGENLSLSLIKEKNGHLIFEKQESQEL